MNLAGFGVKLPVDANEDYASDLVFIAGSSGLKESQVTIRDAQVKSTVDLVTIASVYHQFITYEFSS